LVLAAVAVEFAGLGASWAIAMPRVKAPPMIKALRVFMIGTFLFFFSSE
jgi:hypothetical protein